MCLRTLEALLFYVTVAVLASDDILTFVNGQGSEEMIELGRTQYQLLKERGTLPRYGTCWKSAVDHVEDGCRNLSEDTQSDIALHLTNCFLEQSGHDTYNCELNKKQNLRAICINSMSDRAFNVYTEFYTHTQNMCWFLRGQIWHETISENTFKVGKQLETSAKNQQDLLQAQKESMQMQQNILQHGKMLESVLEDLYISTKAHKEVLQVLTQSLSTFQSWVIGEVSWFDSVIFYIGFSFFTLILTALKQTSGSRLPVLLALLSSFAIERFISYVLMNEDDLIDSRGLYERISFWIWNWRYLFSALVILYIVYHSLKYKDIHVENSKYLLKIGEQNTKILCLLENISKTLRASPSPSDRISLVNENNSFNKVCSNGFAKYSYSEREDNISISTINAEIKQTVRSPKMSRTPLPRSEINGKYNLRSGSKQNTPDPNF